MENYEEIKIFLSKKNYVTKHELLTNLSLSENDIKELVDNNDISIDNNQYYNVNIKKKDIDKKISLLYKAKMEIKNNNLEEAERLLLKYKNIDKSSSSHYQLYLVYYKQRKYKKAYEELLLAKSLTREPNENTYDDKLDLLKIILSKQKNINVLYNQFKTYILYLTNDNKLDELQTFLTISDSSEAIKNLSFKILEVENPEIVKKIKIYKNNSVE